MKPCFFVTTLLFFLLINLVHAQNDGTGNFSLKFKQAKTDTARVNLLLDTGKKIMEDQADSARELFNMALQISSSASFHKGRAGAFHALGLSEYHSGNSIRAMEYYATALALYDSLHDKFNSAVVKYRMGSIFNASGNYAKALDFFQQSLAVLETGTDKRLTASVLNSIGLVHYNFLNDDKAIEYYSKAYNMRKETGDSLGMAVGLFNIANIYLEQKNYLKANEFYTRSLHVSEQISDTTGIAYCYLNLGVLYQRLKKNATALNYFQKAEKIQRSINDHVGLANTLIYIGLLYIDNKEYTNAMQASTEALNLSMQDHLLGIERDANVNLSQIYEQTQDFRNAFSYFKRAKLLSDSIYNSENSKQLGELETKYHTEKKQKEIEILNKDKKLQSIEIREQKFQKIVFIVGFIMVLSLSVFIFRSFRMKQKANRLLVEKNTEIELQKEEIITQSEQLAEINKELEKLSVVASETDNSIVIFDANGKPEWVNAGFTKLNGYTLEEFILEKGDNLFKMSSVSEISGLVNTVVTEKKVVNYTCMISTKHEKKIWVQTTLSPVIDKQGDVIKIIAIDSDISKLKEAETEIKQQKEEIESQRDEIEMQRDKLSLSNKELAYKNKQIIDSITYARLIQEALLPDLNLIRKFIPEFFIFFLPRNIVSGDFYWFYEENDKIFFAVADCTGHGVPGAFMSMIGTTLLNEIVKSRKVQSPSQILTKLNQEINIALKQQDEITRSQGDGMDITFFVYDFRLQKLTVSMANQAIIYICRRNQVSLVKGDIYSVGGIFGSLKQTSFTDHEIDVSTGINLYLFTDGIKDQFNSNNEKFGEDRLMKQLAALREYPMDKQKDILAHSFDQWKGSEAQTDDILVAGIKLCTNCLQ